MSNVGNCYYPKRQHESSDGNRRLYYIDNLKFILMILVVISHFAMKLTYVGGIKYLLYFIYMFHMPCFVFVSGFLAKRINAGHRLRADKILSVLWVYLIFKAGNTVLGYLFHQNVRLSLFKDSSAPWYLLALVIWYLSVPLLERIKTGYLIIGSFMIGLSVGYISSIGQTFTLSRVFVFFPFFIAGYCLSRDRLESFLDKKLRPVAIIFILISLGVMILLWKQVKPFINIIYGASSYTKALGDYAAYGAIVRGIWYISAILLSVSLMLLVPRCRLFFTAYGSRTLQVYITHIWIRNVLVYTGFFTAVKDGPVYYSYLVLIGSAALVFLLSNSWIKKAYDLLMAQKLFAKLIKNTD